MSRGGALLNVAVDGITIAGKNIPGGVVAQFQNIGETVGKLDFTSASKNLPIKVSELKDALRKADSAFKNVEDIDIYKALKEQKVFKDGSAASKYLNTAIELSKPAENVAPDAVKAAENVAATNRLVKEVTGLNIKDITTASKVDKDAAVKQLNNAKNLETDPGLKNTYDKIIQMVNEGDDGLKFIPDWIRNNPTTSFVVLGGTVTGLTFLGLALDRYLKSKNTPRTITKVEKAGGLLDANTIKITYTPDIKILKQDSISIRGSQTTPTIDGVPTIIQSPNDSSVIIEVSGGLRTYTPGGTITVTPDFTASLGREIGKPVGAIANEAGNIAGEGLGAAGGGISEFFSGLFGSGSGTTSMLVLGLILVLMFIK